MIVDKVLNFNIPQTEEQYSQKDAILYALGLNLGLDPVNREELKYLFEENLSVLPTFSMVLAHPGFWLQDPSLEIDWVKILHAEQFLSMSRPLPAKGNVIASYKVLGITDKGEGRGAIVYFEKILKDLKDGEEYSRVTTGVFCRGDGGCGNHGQVPEPLSAVPNEDPDLVIRKTIDPRSALIYRLSGDFNPLHISPDIAHKAGYPQPILHGLCTMGIAGHILLENLAAGDAAQFKGYACRFSRPVFPGDTIRTEIWKNGEVAHFRVIAENRDEVVLDRGQVKLNTQ
ncbi:MAG: MaoC family dehydratase N-terminal domain-containing protein [Sneathiella sp.]|nr:MaoC family dehydratase N-terminal domain-containing protein [Sneathiella sp.]